VTGKRNAWDQTQRQLYLTQRLMRDISVEQRGGPGALARRVARRKLTATLFRVLTRMIRQAGR
jgi:hypothetical protein